MITKTKNSPFVSRFGKLLSSDNNAIHQLTSGSSHLLMQNQKRASDCMRPSILRCLKTFCCTKIDACPCSYAPYSYANEAFIEHLVDSRIIKVSNSLFMDKIGNVGNRYLE